MLINIIIYSVYALFYFIIPLYFIINFSFPYISKTKLSNINMSFKDLKYFNYLT